MLRVVLCSLKGIFSMPSNDSSASCRPSRAEDAGIAVALVRVAEALAHVNGVDCSLHLILHHRPRRCSETDSTVLRLRFFLFRMFLVLTSALTCARAASSRQYAIFRCLVIFCVVAFTAWYFGLRLGFL